MAFNLRRFLRRSSPGNWRTYLDAKGVVFAEAIDWEVPEPELLRTVVNSIEGLAEADRNKISTDFEQIEKLCNPIGQVMLQSVVADNSPLLSQLRATDSNESRAIMILLDHERLFDQALALAYAENLLNGRSWSAFDVHGAALPRTDAETIREFKGDLSKIFQRHDGSGRRLTIDSFERHLLDRDSSDNARNIHYCIYVEGLPESQIEFRDGEPRRHTRSLVDEAAISYDPDRMLVDVITKGGKEVRYEIAQCFARRMLGLTHPIEPISARRYTLNRLKQPHDFPSDTVDRIKSVNVILLRLAAFGSGNGRLTIEIGRPHSADIHACCFGWFGDSDPLKRFDWQVTQAKLRIVFQPESADACEKTVTIDLRAPHGSNLKEQIHHHEIISRKYLARWGLIVETVP